MDGNELKSNDLFTNNTVIKIITENEIDTVSKKSISQDGIGKIRTAIMHKMPAAKKMSRWCFEPFSLSSNDALSIGISKLPIRISHYDKITPQLLLT